MDGDRILAKYQNMYLQESYEQKLLILKQLNLLETEIEQLDENQKQLQIFQNTFNDEIVKYSEQLIIQQDHNTKLLLQNESLQQPELQFQQIKQMLPNFPNLSTFLETEELITAALLTFYVKYFPQSPDNTLYFQLTQYLQSVLQNPLSTPELAQITQILFPQRYRLHINTYIQKIKFTPSSTNLSTLLTELITFLTQTNEKLITDLGDNSELSNVFLAIQQDAQHLFNQFLTKNQLGVKSSEKQKQLQKLLEFLELINNFNDFNKNLIFNSSRNEKIPNQIQFSISNFPNFISSLISTEVQNLLIFNHQQPFSTALATFNSYTTTIIENHLINLLTNTPFSLLTSEKISFKMTNFQHIYTRILIEKVPKYSNQAKFHGEIQGLIRVFLAFEGEDFQLKMVINELIRVLVDKIILERFELFGWRYSEVGQIKKDDEFLSVVSDKFKKSVIDTVEGFGRFVDVDFETKSFVQEFFKVE